MTPYGLSLIGLILASFLPWSYLLQAWGQRATIPRLPLALAWITLGVASYVYIDMLIRFAPEGRPVSLSLFWAASFHVGALALGGLAWALVGPRAAHGFLARPLPYLIGVLALALFTLILGLTFPPTLR